MKEISWFGGWTGNLLIPYARNTQIFECPSRPQHNPVNHGQANKCWNQTRFPVPFTHTSYCYNYVATLGRPISWITNPADQAVMWDGINAWADCGFTQSGSCGIWHLRDIPVFLRKVGKPLHPAMSTVWADNSALVERIAPHNNSINFLFADGHVKTSRWDRMTWGNIGGHVIRDNHPDYRRSLLELPTATWGQGVN
jgi:prepilin-type processing-associated H-X9-DG protein